LSKTAVPFALYDAFSDKLFGGSQGAVVLNASGIDAQTRQTISSELGFPATCFVSSVHENMVTARFHSTVREYPMCGHGTVCLMTHLLAKGMLQPGANGKLEVELVLPTKTTIVEIFTQDNSTGLVMLDIAPPKFRNDQPDRPALAGLLGLNEADIDNSHPVETAMGDFVHLIVPIKSLRKLQAIEPDFSAIKSFCVESGIDTITCFSPETQQPGYDFHVRDFCPAVGVAESAAAGTTNAALAGYWHQHKFLDAQGCGAFNIKVEQGMELGRPSSLHITVHLNHNEMIRLQVGGVATKVISGTLMLPEQNLGTP
jgi:PhzF family phenazine biosynthesis protein